MIFCTKSCSGPPLYFMPFLHGQMRAILATSRTYASSSAVGAALAATAATLAYTQQHETVCLSEDMSTAIAATVAAAKACARANEILDDTAG